MPIFENGWICRECWSANREDDERCYRCHAVPKFWEMPPPPSITPAAAKPLEEWHRVTTLTAAPRPAAVPAQPEPPMPDARPAPRRDLEVVARLRSWFAAAVARARWLWRLVRAAPSAPGVASALVTDRVRAGIRRVTAPFARVLAHRRAGLTVAWLVSALSCALLLSAALDAPFAASLVVVASVAIFSGLTAAFTSSAMERHGRSAVEQPERLQKLDALRDHGLVTPPKHSAQHVEMPQGPAAH